ncbi:hypothetical protein G3O08_04680 [Cryomorpha ignava]|uniref:Uncharacterized protein n=1 Tax=Cryomorpha ignava TaxID=101383 RepID=A0A7K3WPV8_9FLAO|nr:hypothetical protein [Cryomorpha ignava]NEN22795.1 hypothetical protein [Cryomorpha ignava]
MDTSDLSQETHLAIMSEADRFNHDLTIQFGVLSGDCKDEDDFIKQSEELVNKMLKYNFHQMEWIFFGNPPNKKDFQKGLICIFENIQKLKEIPLKDRTYDQN